MNGPSDPQPPASPWAPPAGPSAAPPPAAPPVEPTPGQQPYGQPYSQPYGHPYAVPGGQSWNGQAWRPAGPRRVHVTAGVVGLVALALELWGDWNTVQLLGYVLRGEYPAPYAAAVLVGFASTLLFVVGTVLALVPTRTARPVAALLGLGVAALALSYVVAFAVGVLYGGSGVGEVLLGFVGYTVGYGWYWAGALSALSSVVWVLTLPALWLDTRRSRA